MKISKKSFWLHYTTILQIIMNKLAHKTYEKYLIKVSKMIAIGDRKATMDRDRNFRDQGHDLLAAPVCEPTLLFVTESGLRLS